MTDADAKKLAQFLIQLSGKSSMSGNNTAFSSNNNVRLSRVGKKSDANDPETFIEALDDLTKKVKKSAENWGKQKEKTRDLLNGDRARKVNDNYLKSLRDTANAAGNYSKSIAKAYADAVESNKDNRKAQQAIYNNMNAYTSSMDVLLKHKDSKLKNLSAEDAKEVSLARERVKEAAEQLEKQGILVDVVDNWTKFQKKQAPILEEVVESNKKLLKTTEDFVDELTVVHNKEIKARENLNANIEKFAAAIGAAAIDTVKKVVDNVPSRIANLQQTNDYGTSVDMGVHIQELNPALNSMRHSIILSQKSQADFNAELTSSGDYLHNFGLTAKEALERLVTVKRDSVSAGIIGGKSSTDKLNFTLAQNAAMQGITQQESAAQLTELTNSSAYLYAAMGKDQASRERLLEDQLVNLKKIAMSSGFSAKYAGQMLQENINNRNKGILDKFIGNIKNTIALDQLDAMGFSQTQQEKDIFKKQEAGVPLTSQELGVNAQWKTRKEEFLNNLKQTQGRDILAGQSVTAFGSSIVAERMNQSLVSLDPEAAAANVREITQGAAVASKAWADAVKESMNSITKPESFAMEGKEQIGGALQTPLGSIVGTVGGLATTLLSGLIGGLVANGLKAGMGTVWGSSGAMSLPGLKTLVGRLGVLQLIIGSITGAVTAFNTSTEEYAKQIGINSPESVIGDIAVRTLGTLKDVGRSITFGLTDWIAELANPISMIGPLVGNIVDAFTGTKAWWQAGLDAAAAIIKGLTFGLIDPEDKTSTAGKTFDNITKFYSGEQSLLDTYKNGFKITTSMFNNDAATNATTGKVIDQDGNEVVQTDETNELLRQQLEQQKLLNRNVESGNEVYQLTEQQKAEASIREKSLRNSAQRYTAQLAEKFSDNFAQFNAV